MKKISASNVAALSVAILMIIIFPLRGLPQAQDIKLIVRGDDFAMTQASLIAFGRAFNEGVLTCGSLLVPAPWFEGAAELCRKNPRWCIETCKFSSCT